MSLSKQEKIRQRFSLFQDKHQLYLSRYNANMKYRNNSLKNPSNVVEHLTLEEELTIVKIHEFKMRDFLHNFRPKNEPLPKEVKGISFQYLKRFYLVSSVMDYHPRDVMFACVFLACKIFEYHVPLDLFIKNIDGPPKLMKNILLDCEEALLYRLNFLCNLVTPHNAIEQLIMQLEPFGDMINPTLLYEHIKRCFLADMWLTDVCLLFTPQEIGLATIMYADESVQHKIHSTILANLMRTCHQQDHINDVAVAMRTKCNDIHQMVTAGRQMLTKSELMGLELKLEKCLNPRNNPASDMYRAILEAEEEK